MKSSSGERINQSEGCTVEAAYSIPNSSADQPDLTASNIALKKFISELHNQGSRSVPDMPLPKVTVVMPSYNQAMFLERTILSVLNQTYPRLEFIIIDGGSSDGSVDIIKKYERHLAFWVSEKDNGQSDALNKGFAKATGSIYGWMNSDDLYTPGAIQAAVTALDKQPSANIVFGDYWTIDASDRILDLCYAFDFSTAQFLYEGFHCNAQAMFWRREVHERFGQFDLQLNRTMDYDMILRFGLTEGDSSFLRMPNSLACFRRHENQKTQGFDATVDLEQRRIAVKNGCSAKYSQLGRFMRLIYRARRLLWYWRRGGAGVAVGRVRSAFALETRKGGQIKRRGEARTS